MPHQDNRSAPTGASPSLCGHCDGAQRDPYAAAQAEARARGVTPEDHLWCLALAVGNDHAHDHLSMYEAGDGTPVDVARHATELASALEELRQRAETAEDERDRARKEICRGIARVTYRGRALRYADLVRIAVARGWHDLYRAEAEKGGES